MSAVGRRISLRHILLLHSADVDIDLVADPLCSSTAPHAADKAAAAADVGLPGQRCSGFQHCCPGGLTAAVHEDSRGLAIQCITLQYDR